MTDENLIRATGDAEPAMVDDEALSDELLEAANLAYTEVLFPECSRQSLIDEWARMPASQKANCMAAMRAALSLRALQEGARQSPAETRTTEIAA